MSGRGPGSGPARGRGLRSSLELRSRAGAPRAAPTQRRVLERGGRRALRAAAAPRAELAGRGGGRICRDAQLVLAGVLGVEERVVGRADEVVEPVARAIRGDETHRCRHGGAGGGRDARDDLAHALEDALGFRQAAVAEEDHELVPAVAAGDVAHAQVRAYRCRDELEDLIAGGEAAAKTSHERTRWGRRPLRSAVTVSAAIESASARSALVAKAESPTRAACALARAFNRFRSGI